MWKDVVVKRGKSGGQGEFAKKRFDKGEIILVVIRGRLVKRKDAKSITPKSARWDHYDKNHYHFMGDPEFYINHCCEPNAYQKNRRVYAMRPIKRGEEIHFDYSISGIDNWKMRCKCGAKTCRKLVDGRFFKLPLAKQQEYLPYLDRWCKSGFASRVKKLKKS